VRRSFQRFARQRGEKILWVSRNDPSIAELYAVNLLRGEQLIRQRSGTPDSLRPLDYPPAKFPTVVLVGASARFEPPPSVAIESGCIDV
jgi:hypothetical protein